MTVPYTVTTPEYVKWAREGEKESKHPFTVLVDEICKMAEANDFDWKVYGEDREKLKDAFDLHECDR